MKKNYITMAFMTLFGVFMAHDAVTNSTGAPNGSNGSPSSNSSCARSSCHNGGPAQSSETVSISTDIPAGGFVENTSYTITIDANDGGRNLNRMGFQASVESSAGFEGNITVTDAANTQKFSNYITHTFSGISVSGGQKSWSFDWNSGTAPDQTEVYVAVNFANGNGANSGDVIVTESLVLNKEMGVSLPEAKRAKFSIYPNPAQELITLASDHELKGALTILDAAGRTVKYNAEVEKIDSQHWKVNVSELPAGVYILKTQNSNSALFTKE